MVSWYMGIESADMNKFFSLYCIIIKTCSIYVLIGSGMIIALHICGVAWFLRILRYSRLLVRVFFFHSSNLHGHTEEGFHGYIDNDIAKRIFVGTEKWVFIAIQIFN
uniref:Uncharacterized protein n=1 Tax=Nelumbo nucifera TaxID=4432 RepID=A0A822Z4C7_NELNU|nr:TPA_asm: hypothetical protein HUJ06_007019 [Nelumbo nucifera]